eukprot:8758908-Pyramimonas_sp.AAC.1
MLTSSGHFRIVLGPLCAYLSRPGEIFGNSSVRCSLLEPSRSVLDVWEGRSKTVPRTCCLCAGGLDMDLVIP